MWFILVFSDAYITFQRPPDFCVYFKSHHGTPYFLNLGHFFHAESSLTVEWRNQIELILRIVYNTEKEQTTALDNVVAESQKRNTERKSARQDLVVMPSVMGNRRNLKKRLVWDGQGASRPLTVSFFDLKVIMYVFALEYVVKPHIYALLTM